MTQDEAKTFSQLKGGQKGKKITEVCGPVDLYLIATI